VGDHRQRHYAAGVRPGIASQRGTGGRRRAANLRVVWCARTSGQADPTPFFPGDASTSWFALDGYDRPGPWCVLHGVPHHVSPVHTDQRPARDNRRDDFCREPTRPIGRGHLDHLGVLPGDPHLGHLVADRPLLRRTRRLGRPGPHLVRSRPYALAGRQSFRATKQLRRTDTRTDTRVDELRMSAT
jgi:hypothetical protein